MFKLSLKSPVRGYLILELSFLLLLFGIGIWTVSAHWTSIWMDREFTGWVAPISNRIANGQKLYADGGYIPMPPLSFVLISVLIPGNAIWYSENLLNYFFQALTIITLYLGLSLYFLRPLPFLGVLGSIPIFLSLPKTILYDAMAQFWVAALAVVSVSYVMRWERFTNRLSLVIGCNFAMGTLTAACLLTKQSTGAGSFLGVLLLLGVLPRHSSIRVRLRDAFIYGVSTILALGIIGLVLSPYINFVGLINNVFLTGSEPKGGTQQVILNLVEYSKYIVELLVNNGLSVFFIGGAFTVLLGFTKIVGANRDRTDISNSHLHFSQYLNAHRPALYYSAIAAVSAVLALTIAWENFFPQAKSFHRITSSYIAVQLLSVSLVLCIVISLFVIGTAFSRPQKNIQKNAQTLSAIAGFFLILFPAAVFHSLSVSSFRWHYDNNPLIVLALVSLFLVSLAMTETIGNLVLPKRKAILTAGAIFVLQACFWSNYSHQLRVILQCTETWPEVSFLDGARLPASAQGMRDLTNLVRGLARDEHSDQVLLLPNDPNVEAWFERPRPKLSSAIIFADQYWDRYVDLDFNRLAVEPPKVIVIGPRGFWSFFHSKWNKNYGALRLIKRVEEELLPRFYQLYASQEITFRGEPEFMDVYLRK